MEELTKMDKEQLLHHRMLKFRSIGDGGFQEGVPVDPERKCAMRPSDINTTKADDIETDLENLKKEILEAKGSPGPITIQTIEKLKQDLDHELTKAFISMGLQDKIEALKLDLSRVPNGSSNQPFNPALKEKADQIMLEFKQKLSRPRAYLGLKQKLDKLNMVSRLIELKEKGEKLKAEINQRVPEDIKAKKELMMKARESLSKGEPLDDNLSEEVEKVKKELEDVLKSANLEIVGVIKDESGFPVLKETMVNVNVEIGKEIKRAVDATGLSCKIEMLREEIAKGSSSEKVKKLEEDMKEGIAAAMDITTLKEKVESLKKKLEQSNQAITGDKVGGDSDKYQD